MSFKNYWILILLLCVIVFSWSLYRDIQAEKQYTGDLRNRVVGARLQKDGLSPYFYKWKKGDGLRYYDPNNFDSLQVSNITGSPFFHRLFYPVAELPQKTISVYWLMAEYTMFIVIILLSLSLAVNDQQKWMVLVAACLFLLSEAWKLHTANGQNYVCIPVLALAFYCSINKQGSLLDAFIGGCLAIMLLLIKPNAILFFIPFLLVVKRYHKSWIGMFILPAIITCLLIVSSSKEVALWKQYKEGITQQIRIHQHESPVLQSNEPDPSFARWEGIDRAEIQKQAALHPLYFFSENGNFFVVAQLLLHKKINTTVLLLSSICAFFLLLLIFFIRHRATGFSLYRIALAGFCLYMLSDLFSPIYRHQYYGVLWMFPVFLSAAFYNYNERKIYWLIGIGLLLNVLNIAFMPLEHTLGEYIMLLAFIVLSLRRETETIQ